MKIFGKSVGEYVSFQKVILGLIVVVGVARLGLSLAGAPDSMAKWLSITVVMLIGFLYYSIKVHTTGFGSYRHLLPLLVIQNAVATAIIVLGIAIAIGTGNDNIFSVPEYSGGTDGKNWTHAGLHVLFGVIASPLVFWLFGSVIMFVVKKATSGDKAAAARA